MFLIKETLSKAIKAFNYIEIFLKNKEFDTHKEQNLANMFT